MSCKLIESCRRLKIQQKTKSILVSCIADWQGKILDLIESRRVKEGGLRAEISGAEKVIDG